MGSLATPWRKQEWTLGSRAQGTFVVEPALMAAWYQPWCEAKASCRSDHYGIVQFYRQYQPELLFIAPNSVIPYQNYNRIAPKFHFQGDGKGSEGVRQVGNDYIVFVSLLLGCRRSLIFQQIRQIAVGVYCHANEAHNWKVYANHEVDWAVQEIDRLITIAESSS